MATTTTPAIVWLMCSFSRPAAMMCAKTNGSIIDKSRPSRWESQMHARIIVSGMVRRKHLGCAGIRLHAASASGQHRVGFYLLFGRQCTEKPCQG